MVFDLHLVHDLDLHSVENITMTLIENTTRDMIISLRFYCFRKIKE